MVDSLSNRRHCLLQIGDETLINLHFDQHGTLLFEFTLKSRVVRADEGIFAVHLFDADEAAETTVPTPCLRSKPDHLFLLNEISAASPATQQNKVIEIQDNAVFADAPG